MAGQAKTDRRMSLAEFLKWDDGTDTRYELIDGRATAMNPPMARHARLVSHVVGALLARVRSGCGVYTGGGARRVDDDWNYRVPDVTVSCSPSERQWVESPKLVCEVLSPSTARADQGGKLAFYRTISSIEEILILRSEKRHAELWRRAGDHWTVHDFIGSAEIPLAIATQPIPLDELYAPLELDAEDRAAPDPT